ncbi:hypothetical protein LguiA_001836 [Lonicera macranthoides]
MYPPYRHGGGAGGHGPPPQFNSNFVQNPNLFLQQNPSFPIQNPNFPIQNPNFAIQNPFSIPNPNFPIQNPNFTNTPTNFPVRSPNFRPNQFPNPPRPIEALERINRAVVKARLDLLAAGETASAWKVSQAVLLILKADSWESLGFQMQQVPSLHRLIVTEGKINAFIHCFVGVRRITSLYDLEVAICQNEGVGQFEELEMGPLVRHPLVVHYFSVSSDVTEVFRITTEEIISYLSELMNDHKGKEIKADDLLDFIAKKKAVEGREKLAVRIQSLGMHITHIRKAKRSETTVLDKCLEGVSRKAIKKNKKRPLFSSQKKQLDQHFNAITKRVDSFSSTFGKHIRFTSSSEEDGSDNCDGEDDKNQNDEHSRRKFSSRSVNSSDRVSSCPYPSATEEMNRLGLRSETDPSPSSASDGLTCNEPIRPFKRKRKSENISGNAHGPYKVPDFSTGCEKKGDSSKKNKVDYSLPDESVRMFLMTWKEACRENSVIEVLERMLQLYDTKKKERVKHIFSTYPCIGLLNVAVTSMKSGMWDSIYDTFQIFSQQEVSKPTSEKFTDYISIEVEPSQKNALVTEHVLGSPQVVIVEDILKKISTYFELDRDILGNANSSLEKKFSFLRELCKCEFWLSEQFSVKEFKSLGYGDFFTFLEKQFSLLPQALQKCLAGDTHEKISLEATMLKSQLSVLLSQANIESENENSSKERISKLLTRQFPSICFRLAESGSMKDIQDLVMENKSNGISNCLLYSATLFGMGHKEDDLGHNEGTLGSFTTKDAIEVLLRAPMLSDIDLWSHWDLIFAPSLGPLVGWLLNEVNNKELLCLVTKGGKVLRIDHSATVDSFLEAFLQGSSFQTALQLLSLFAFYGGEQVVPLSLLKCNARRAFEVILKNSTEIEVNSGQKFLTEHMFDESASNKDTDGVNKAVPFAANFILNCLDYLPAEIRSFAADVLLSGLQPAVKDAPLAILNECKKLEQRLIIHEVGLSLGIVEWINDYHTFCSSKESNSCSKESNSELIKGSKYEQHDASSKIPSSEGEIVVPVEVDGHNEECKGVVVAEFPENFGENCLQNLAEVDKDIIPAMVIESIRREEFGLDPTLSVMENSMLKKQHARLGRALHCLSQELYSQDSHFLLELIQNADDNVYPKNVEPTLTFILKEGGIVVLNNEQGFSAENIRALCDVGNSTKKGATAGYIGKKGIGFKSVFRVSDAPEIHSNGYHIKFDITEGQIGFVLPTVVPPCDIHMFSKLASMDTTQVDDNFWNTCVVLPFRSKFSKDFALNNIISMFSDLHPSLLLFLHRLKCIKFRNTLNDSLVVMRKEILGHGIVNVSFGKEKMTWFVTSQKLLANAIRPDVQTTEISIAFTLQESGNRNYIPRLDTQPVFAFLPLRTYGLKFILQGDFVLPSSREEVDGDSPWNQWLLSEFPGLFVTAERSFCGLPCFSENRGKAVSAFMSFVPLIGEVHGFFSSLPRMITSKLRMSNCLLLEGDSGEWVPPCKVLRNWTGQARTLLPDNLLREHLGLGFLNKDVVLSDSLARALGIEEYGPKILVQIISSLCHKENGLRSMGLPWLSSWLNAIYLISYSTESDLVSTLRKIPFIPLSDGRYGAVDDGTIWLHSDALSTAFNNEYHPEAFPKLYAKLRTVSPALYAAANDEQLEASTVENVTRMLCRVGVQQLSAHEIVKVHILPAIFDESNAIGNNELMTEYLSFVMFHLQSSCLNCCVEREYIISELRNKALILTNHGFKRPFEVPIHFNKEFGNPIDVNKLINSIDIKWHEVDIAYLKHPITKSVSGGMLKWRTFFQELGLTDFVHIVQIEKPVTNIFHLLKNITWEREMISSGSVAKDWESQELVNLLSQLSSSGDHKRCKHLLGFLDTLWDNCFSDKVTGYCKINSSGESKPFKSSFITLLHDTDWIVSSMDNELHKAKDLFHDCEAVKSILGSSAPYAIPKIRSEKLLNDVGLKTRVTLDDVLSVLQVWRRFEMPFKASISQMAKFYTFISNQMATSKQKIMENFGTGAFIFVPYSSGSKREDIVPGVFLTPQEVYWHDSTGSMDQMKVLCPAASPDSTHRPFSKMLCNIYPSLRDFFVNECGVNQIPPFRSYLQILLQLSSIALPSQAAKTVLQVFVKWNDGYKSGLLNSEDIEYFKENLVKEEFTVLPTALDKWVSLHPSFGLVCWCDDDKLRKEFKNFNNIDFLYFGEFSDNEEQMETISPLIRRLGIPALSEVTTREAIYYGPADSSFKTSLVNWALPYAQRYIYNAYPDKYSQLKQSGFEILNRIRIIVVEKLFCRNVIKRADITSKKRCECSCLQQDNILYITTESDSHSIFMELSRMLLDGNPELHLANFLHMITTMAESGSTEDQTEFFISNSQKIPKLPVEESIWAVQSPPPSSENDQTVIASSALAIMDEITSRSKRKTGTYSSWPPADWRTAPGFNYSRANGFRTQPASGGQQAVKGDNDEVITEETHPTALIEINSDWTIEEVPPAIIPTISLQDTETLEDQTVRVSCGTNAVFDTVDLSAQSSVPSSSISTSMERDQLSSGTVNPQQALLTGREGEFVAFKYFIGKFGDPIVKWVNEANETGLPYDIVLGDNENNREYIEVKATKSARKDWFNISVREWQFAVEKGESFSIARVVLLGNNMGRVTIYKNPVRLCHLGQLQLALVMPKQQKEFSIV